jgi:hypothetical protein
MRNEKKTIIKNFGAGLPQITAWTPLINDESKQQKNLHA